MGRTKSNVSMCSLSADHPHARGENSRRVPDTSGHDGPSPRTWGELKTAIATRSSMRTIPTHVGRTRFARSTRLCQADHPHARGENYAASKRAMQCYGPSPRTWGEPLAPRAKEHAPRTIPTHVGRTVFLPHSSRQSSDHPHARGENNLVQHYAEILGGPSPRTWGELQGASSRERASRTIPTHVGRTAWCLAPGKPGADHPHARGENCISSTMIGSVSGPSPRTWGELLVSSDKAIYLGTIPTHVGRTSIDRGTGTVATDHPHARGEN